jgi:hypothetical protein
MVSNDMTCLWDGKEPVVACFEAVFLKLSAIAGASGPLKEHSLEGIF